MYKMTWQRDFTKMCLCLALNKYISHANNQVVFTSIQYDPITHLKHKHSFPYTLNMKHQTRLADRRAWDVSGC